MRHPILYRAVISIVLAAAWTLPVPAQQASMDSLMTFAGNIHMFNQVFPQEKVYLQFDNTSYYSGETIWFKAFVVSASNLDRPQSRVLYVDLISPTGVLLKQQKLKITAGQADGSLPLIDGSTSQAREKRGVMGYPSGFYEVRAYTSFMQNFSEEAIFSRVFAVYEKPEKEGAFYEESPVIKLRTADLAQARPKSQEPKKLNVSFHPEGGHLVTGKTSRVAFKVTDETGLGVHAQVSLEGSDKIFETLHDGMGSFTYTPGESRGSVRVTTDNSSRSFSLPKSEESGCVLSVSILDNDSLRIGIDATPDFDGADLGITLTCRGELMDFKPVTLTGAQSVQIVDMHGIPEGVCHICLFDRNGTIFASRHFYHRSTTVRHPILSVTTDKASYKAFEKVSLSLDLMDGNGKPFRDRFCLAVRDTRGQASALESDLRSDLLLASDLRGHIANPGWYFEQTDGLHTEALDLLTLVQGWERYDWQTMTGRSKFSEVHRLEKSLTLNGWILSPSGKKPLEGIEVMAAMMPEDKSLSETYRYTTDSTGYFGFDIGPEFYDKARFSIDTHVERERLLGTSARIMFDRSMVPSIRAYNQEELQFHPTDGNIGSTLGNPAKKADDGLPTVIDADQGYLLPDVDIDEERMYLDYFTFNAFDVIKDVEVDLDKGDYSTDLMGYLLDKGFQVLIDENGAIESINGFEPFFYVHNNSKYLNSGIWESPSTIDSKDIVSIIVFERPMYMLNIITQCPLFMDYMDKTLSDITDTETLYQRRLLVDVLVKEEHQLSTRKELYKINKRLTTVDGYSRPYSFYSPQYPNGAVMGDVDYRRTLYWEPNVVTDSLGHADVEFYNSSITKHFNIKAAGITSSGIPYVFDRNF